MHLLNYNSSKIRKRQDAKEATRYIIYTVPLHQLTNVWKLEKYENYETTEKLCQKTSI